MLAEIKYRKSHPLARIIHQPEKSTAEGDVVGQMNPTTTVPQAHDAPQTISSGLPETIHLGRIGAIGCTASCQPLGPPSAAGHVSCLGALDRPHRACQVRRTQANKVKLRLRTGATGHDEGNDMVIRSVNSWTRAPSLSKRSWIVSIVALAHDVPCKTSRRKVSSNT